MKKLLKIALLVCALMLLLCIGALAADEPTVAGIYGVTSEEGVMITPQKADRSNISSSNLGGDYSEFYTDAVRMGVSISDAEKDAYYLLIVTNKDLGTTMPEAKDIVYIDQVTASKSEDSEDYVASFNAYPSSLEKGTYYIYLSSSSGTELTKVGTFQSHVPYTLGDVNDDNAIDSEDALLALKHFVGLVTLDTAHQAAANVNLDTAIDSEDALLILKYFVGIIETF